jgi:hypothetical protein
MLSVLVYPLSGDPIQLIFGDNLSKLNKHNNKKIIYINNFSKYEKLFQDYKELNKKNDSFHILNDIKRDNFIINKKILEILNIKEKELYTPHIYIITDILEILPGINIIEYIFTNEIQKSLIFKLDSGDNDFVSTNECKSINIILQRRQILLNIFGNNLSYYNFINVFIEKYNINKKYIPIFIDVIDKVSELNINEDLYVIIPACILLIIKYYSIQFDINEIYRIFYVTDFKSDYRYKDFKSDYKILTRYKQLWSIHNYFFN